MVANCSNHGDCKFSFAALPPMMTMAPALRSMMTTRAALALALALAVVTFVLWRRAVLIASAVYMLQFFSAEVTHGGSPVSRLVCL